MLFHNQHYWCGECAGVICTPPSVVPYGAHVIVVSRYIQEDLSLFTLLVKDKKFQIRNTYR